MRKIKVYTSEDRLVLSLYASLIEAAGIEVEVRNDLLSGAAGGIPTDVCWPEIWVDESDREAAEAVLERIRAGGADGAAIWTCTCGETIEPQFEACWACGAPRP